MAATLALYSTQLSKTARPGRVAATPLSTAPATSATAKPYVCSHPRIRGLPRSVGGSRTAVVRVVGY
jgi:hypothetical protein